MQIVQLTSLYLSGMNSVGANSRMNQHGLPSRQHAAMGSSRVARQATPHGYHPVSYTKQIATFVLGKLLDSESIEYLEEFSCPVCIFCG